MIRSKNLCKMSYYQLQNWIRIPEKSFWVIILYEWIIVMEILMKTGKECLRYHSKNLRTCNDMSQIISYESLPGKEKL